MYDLTALRDAALTLENDGGFYAEYTQGYCHTGVDFRRIIQKHMRLLKLKRLSIKGDGSADEAYGREQLRRYFHERYKLPTPPDRSSCPDIESVDFWNDPTENPIMPCMAATQPQPQPEEPTMTAPASITVEQRTFVNGADVSKMSDSDIYGLIAQEELTIKQLEAIENKPNRLQAEITKRRDGIKALVETLNARDAK